MGQRCIELPGLDVPINLVKGTAIVVRPEPLPVRRYVAYFFFPLRVLSACSTSWMMLLSFIGLSAISSDAAATIIQKAADSSTAITL